MKEFFCEMLELDLRVAADQFDKEAFLAEVKKIDERDTDVREYTFGSSTKPDKQHAHIIVDFHKEDRYRFRIIYYSRPGENKDTEPPHMEDCAEWLARFFRNDEIQGTIHAIYEFDERWAPVVPVPFPLVVASERLAGSKVTGIALQLPAKMRISRAILQGGDKKGELSVQIDSKIKTRLSEFRLTSELERLAIVVMALVNPVSKQAEEK